MFIIEIMDLLGEWYVKDYSNILAYPVIVGKPQDAKKFLTVEAAKLWGERYLRAFHHRVVELTERYGA